MRTANFVALTFFLTALSSCDNPHDFVPTGQWEVLEREEVYENNDHPLIVTFVLEKGERCAISEKVMIRKDMGCSKVSCPKGSGWIYSTLNFKKLSD